MSKLTQADVDSILKWRSHGFTYRFIADMYGVSMVDVQYHCAKHKVATPPRKGWRTDAGRHRPQSASLRYRPYTPREDRIIESRLARGVSYVDIGRELDRSPSSVQLRANRLAFYAARESA